MLEERGVPKISTCTRYRWRGDDHEKNTPPPPYERFTLSLPPPSAYYMMESTNKKNIFYLISMIASVCVHTLPSEISPCQRSRHSESKILTGRFCFFLWFFPHHSCHWRCFPNGGKCPGLTNSAFGGGKCFQIQRKKPWNT